MTAVPVGVVGVGFMGARWARALAEHPGARLQVVCDAREQVRNGGIGAVQAVRGERIGLVTDQEILQGRTSLALYYGVHELDLARWYAGDVDRVCAARSRGVLASRGYAFDDLYSATLTFRNGAHGTVVIGWSLPPETPGWGLAGVTVVGDAGVVRVSQGDLGFLAVTADGVRNEDVFFSPEVHGRLRGAFATEVDHFVEVVAGRTDPLCTASDGLEAVRASLALEESAATGEVVAL